MHPFITIDLSEERWLDLADLEEGQLSAYLQEHLHYLYPGFQKNGGVKTQLEKEVQQLLPFLTLEDTAAWTFVDHWTIDWFGPFDLATANQCRALLYLLYVAFEESEFISILAEHFEQSETDLRAKANAAQFFHWLLLWAIGAYPNLLLLLFKKKTFERFEPFRALPLHTVIRYLPRFLLWDIGAHLKKPEKRYLLQQLAAGKHLRKCSTCPAPFSKKMAHHFTQAPLGSSFESAVWYGIVRGLNGAAVDIPVFEKQFGNDYQDLTFIGQVIGFFNRPGQRVEPEELEWLLGYFQHFRQEHPNGSIKGWTLDTLRRRAEQWYAEINQRYFQGLRNGWPRNQANLKSKDHWEGANYRPYQAQYRGEQYQIVQLTSRRALLAEGQALLHCVGSYTPRCVLFGTSIWSLQVVREGKSISLVTIEVSSKNRVLQARGKRNAAPAPYQREMIRRWKVREGLG